MSAVTQSDIAQALGLSQATVGLVVGTDRGGPRGKMKLKPETIERIQKKAVEMGYRPHRHARAMRTGRTMLVGMVYEGGMLQAANERAFHISRTLKERGYSLMTLDSHWYQGGVTEALGQMIEARVDGIVLAGVSLSAERVKAVMAQKIPLVGLSCRALPGIPSVRCDMADGSRKLVDHLLAQGHRWIVQHGSPVDRAVAPEQWEGWQSSLQAIGFRDGILAAGGSWQAISLEEYPEWARSAARSSSIMGVTLCETEERRQMGQPFDPYQRGALFARDLLSAAPRLPDAILCKNDDITYGLANELLRAGYALPADVAVAGFNDTALGQAFFVPLTSVRQATGEMSDAAVNLLIDQIEGKPCRNEITSFPCELLVRASSLKRKPASSPA